MDGSVTVMAAGEFQQWLAANGDDGTFADEGGAALPAAGCWGCHGAGARVQAPALTGLYGRPVALRNGGTAIADDGYHPRFDPEPQKRSPPDTPRSCPPLPARSTRNRSHRSWPT